MASINISGYTFSTTSVPTSPAMKVKSGTGTYYVNLTTGQRPEALSDQKVFTVSTTNYSFLRPFVTSNSLTGYSGVSNNSTITTGYSGVSNNSTVTTGYAGVSSRSSTYGYSGYSSFERLTTTKTNTSTTLSVTIRTDYIGPYLYEATFSSHETYLVSCLVSYRYLQDATRVETSSSRNGYEFMAGVGGYGGQVGQPYMEINNSRSIKYLVYLTERYKGTSVITATRSVYTHEKVTESTTIVESGYLLSQVPLTTSSSYNSSSTAKGNLSSITDLTITATRYSSSTEKAYLSSITNLTETATRYSSSVAVGNLSSTTELRTITRL